MLCCAYLRLFIVGFRYEPLSQRCIGAADAAQTSATASHDLTIEQGGLVATQPTNIALTNITAWSDRLASSGSSRFCDARVSAI